MFFVIFFMGRNRQSAVDEAGEIFDAICTSPVAYDRFCELAARNKFYENREGDIPEGKYVELNVTSKRDPRRFLVEVETGETFLTTRHYQPGSFEHIGVLPFVGEV